NRVHNPVGHALYQGRYPQETREKLGDPEPEAGGNDACQRRTKAASGLGSLDHGRFNQLPDHSGPVWAPEVLMF
ncbi:MAG: hypothetical protein ACRD1T_28175, partial [Acidimicrobiia bacterium]